MKRSRLFLALAASVLGALSFVPQQATADDGRCQGRKSWLSDACTFCQTASCGECTFYCTNPPADSEGGTDTETAN
jgi:hypothetical protein